MTRAREKICSSGRYVYEVRRVPTQGRTVYWYAVELFEGADQVTRAKCETRKAAVRRCQDWADRRAQMVFGCDR